MECEEQGSHFVKKQLMLGSKWLDIAGIYMSLQNLPCPGPSKKKNAGFCEGKEKRKERMMFTQQWNFWKSHFDKIKKAKFNLFLD